MTNQKYFNGDKVKLPFDETGIVERYEERLWGSKYWVKVSVSNGFNKVDEIVDIFEKHLELENK